MPVSEGLMLYKAATRELAVQAYTQQLLHLMSSPGRSCGYLPEQNCLLTLKSMTVATITQSWFCLSDLSMGMTSLRGMDLAERHPHKPSVRCAHLPIDPSKPHPDNHILLKLDDGSPMLRK